MNRMTVLVAAMCLTPLLASAAPPPSDALVRLTRSPVKPGGPIAVEYRLQAELEVGVPLEISITARIGAGVDNVSIEAYPSAPHAVLVTPPESVGGGNGAHSWSITVVPLAAEAGYLTVVVSGEVDGLAQARSVTVPLRGAAPAAVAPAPRPADSEALIALPVQEGP